MGRAGAPALAVVACEGKCAEGQTCGIVGGRGATCESKLTGVCWVLPQECPALELAQYNICNSVKCVGLCEAVQNGEAAVPDGLGCLIQ